MIVKKYKLPVQEFIGKHGKIVKNTYFILKVFPTSSIYGRFGTVISKKVHPSAVKRNKLKRLVFNLLKIIANQLQNNDYLIVFLPSINKLNNEQVKQELKSVLSRFIRI